MRYNAFARGRLGFDGKTAYCVNACRGWITELVKKRHHQVNANDSIASGDEGSEGRGGYGSQQLAMAA